MNTLRNSVNLIGNIGQDPELKTFESGKKMVKLNLATNEYYKNNKGEKQQDTQWHSIVAWGKTAEMMSEMLTKGNEVAIQGKLVHRSYEDKDGNKRYISEVVANEFMKLTKAALPF